MNWDFLDHVSEKKGFSPRWRKWMSGCLSTVSYAILVNGNAKGWVKASRGLRQGDPLSPFFVYFSRRCTEQDVIETRGKKFVEEFQGG